MNRTHLASLAGKNNGTKLFSQYATVKFEVESKPAPGSPFHLAIPVHNMKAGVNCDFLG